MSAGDLVGRLAGDLVGRLAGAGIRRGDPVAVAVGADGATGLATTTGSWLLPASTPADAVAALAAVEARLGPRWVWWSARADATTLVEQHMRPGACWDLAAVHRLLHGGSADAPARVWAASRGLPMPPEESVAPRTDGQLDLLADPSTGGGDEVADQPLDDSGHLRPEWTVTPSRGADRVRRWATLAAAAHEAQAVMVGALPDHRAHRGTVSLPVLTARAESAADLLAVELATDGLPLDRATAEALIAAHIGPRPSTVDDEAAGRAERDSLVLRHVGEPVDLRNPAQVRALLASVGVRVPDTRSWRLEPLRDAHPVVESLLAWRKAERMATTYGYAWLDRHVGADGRLRGPWRGSDGGAGRMTAGNGLHNLPAELRPAVAAEAGHILVRADLGQIEPRVLAAVSGDTALAAATSADDLYRPVAEQLRCDRPRAKVAVLAAMYGQTSGTAGAALRAMQSTYPVALAFLDTADRSGRDGVDVRTVGGRLIRVGTPASPGAAAAHGRYARNAVVQGAAAELFKAWAVTVRASLPALGGSIVLCLHDELLLHVPAERAGAAADLLRDALTETGAWWAAGSGVRFVADVAVVRRWSDAKS